MSKIPYIKYAEMKPFYTIHELCDLFRMGKDDLRDACKRYQVEPRQNEIGDWGFVTYDVRRLHNKLYHEGEATKGVTRGPDDVTHGKGGRILSPDQQTAGAEDDPVR